MTTNLGEIEEQTLNFEVEDTPPAEFEFSNLSVSYSTIDKNQNVDLMLDVENTGDETDSYTVEFYVDGESVGTDTVEVKGRETETASVTYSADDDGTYTVTVDEIDEEVSFEVVDVEGIIDDLFERGMWCIAVAIIVPIIIIIVIIVVVVKLASSKDEGGQGPSHGQPPQQQPPP